MGLLALVLVDLEIDHSIKPVFLWLCTSFGLTPCLLDLFGQDLKMRDKWTDDILQYT